MRLTINMDVQMFQDWEDSVEQVARFMIADNLYRRGNTEEVGIVC